MRKVLLSLCLAFIFVGCNRTADPKVVLQKFIESMRAKNYEEARKYATADSQSFLEMLSKDKKSPDNSGDEKKFSITAIRVNEDNATADVLMFSGNIPVTFSLKKEKSEWKVEFNLNALIKMAEGAADPFLK